MQQEEGTLFDAVVVGGGISGLCAASYLVKVKHASITALATESVKINELRQE